MFPKLNVWNTEKKRKKHLLQYKFVKYLRYTIRISYSSSFSFLVASLSKTLTSECCTCGKLASWIYFSCLEIASHHRTVLAPAILHNPEVMIIIDCLYQASTIHLAKFLFDLRTESDLTLLPDAGHVLAHAGGEDASKMASDPV